MMNRYVINPAFTGIHDYFEANTNYRNQWVGITDAPTTYILSVHGPHKYKSYGLGGAIFADVTGPTSRTGISFSYAYHFKLNDHQNIALGLSGGLLQFAVDGTQINLIDPGDLVLTNTLMSTIVPDFGFGALWYKKDKYYVGFSVPQFIQNRLQFFDNSTQTLSNLTAHYFLNAGYKFEVHELFSIEPSMLVKYSPPVIPQLDLGAKFYYDDVIYLGTVFRTQDAFSILVGYTTPDQRFTFGYAYDISTSNINNYSAGSHEIMVAARFGNVKSKSKKKKKMSKLEQLEQRLKELEEEEAELDESLYDDGENLEEAPKKDVETDIEPESEADKLSKELEKLEKQDRELRQKVRDLREEAKSEGKSPNDSSFSKRQEYLDALDDIKAIYLRKKEIDKLLN